MVASIDGRIDCSMVDKISGEEYYTALEQLDCPSLLEGRVTMEHYNSAKEPFVPTGYEPVDQPSVSVAEESCYVTREYLGLPWEKKILI